MEDEIIDIHARDRIDAHEEVCAERYEGIDHRLSEIEKITMLISNRLWGLVMGVAGSVIALLVTVIMFLVDK